MTDTREITKYKKVSGEGHEIVDEVSWWLERGYQPLGGISARNNGDCYQAMVKYKD